MFHFFKERNFMKAGRDYREAAFFLLFALSSYLKFYYLEGVLTPSISRSYNMISAAWGIIFCIIALVLLLHRAARPAVLLALSFSFSALAVTDVLYMRYYADMFSFINISLASQVMEIRSSVAELLSPADLLWFLDTPLLAASLLCGRRLSEKPLFKPLTFRRLLFSLLIFCTGAGALLSHLAIYNKKIPGVLTAMWNRPAVSNNIGVMSYHAVDARNTAFDALGKGRVSEEEVGEISDWFSRRNALPDSSPLYGAASGKNIIVIQVESLQGFIIGLKHGGAEVTPHLNRLLKESVYFSCVYSQTGSGNSSDAEFLSNTGMFPAAAGVAFTRFAANNFASLPRLLAREGYSALALHGDRPGFWNRHKMYPALGFRRFVSRFDFEEDEIIGMGISDKSFFRQTLEILVSERQPFYAFLVTLTSHHPFNYAPMLEQTKFETGEFSGQFMGNYLTAMRYADEQLGSFIEGLRRKGLLDKSVLIIYGDHAAVPPSSRPQLEKLAGRDLSPGWAWRSMNKVPLIIRLPSEKRISYTDGKPAGLVDLPSTVASLLGLNYGAGFGTALFSGKRNEPVIFSKGSYVTGDIYVEPAAARATDIRNGIPADFTAFSRQAAEVEKRLLYNNKILEHDLAGRLNKAAGASLTRKK